MNISVEKLKELVKDIEKKYEVEPNDRNQGDCMNGKEALDMLMRNVLTEVKKIK